MYKSIVVGTDLSSTAQIATDRAANLAKKLGAELFLVHAGSDPGEPLQHLADDYEAEVVVKQGPPVDVLIDEAEKHDSALLAVGSVGMSGAKRFLLGNVPNKVSHHATSDLLIVKTSPPPEHVGDYRGILVGADGSGTAMRAVEMASDLAKHLGIKPMIVTAYQPPTEDELKRMRSDPNDPLNQWSSGRSQRSTPDEFKWRLADASQAQDVLERAVEHASKLGVDAECKAVEGPPAETLIQVARDESVDLIVVGSVGMTGAKRFSLGNVPNRVSHHAPTDVLILHTTS
ncbi:MAG: universal stress protein [Actinomycetota bacterium]|nr:universal stress protein [Actinomycetota bacterium]